MDYAVQARGILSTIIRCQSSLEGRYRIIICSRRRYLDVASFSRHHKTHIETFTTTLETLRAAFSFHSLFLYPCLGWMRKHMPERYGHPQLQAIVCPLSTKYNLTVLCCLCIENDPHVVLRGPQVVQAFSRLAKLLDTRRLRDRPLLLRC